MVYVDQLRKYTPTKIWPYSSACHLLADTVDELHAFAQRIGLNRAWFQDGNLPHYDLTARRRAAAVKAGAQEIGVREVWERVKAHRLQNGAKRRKRA